MFSDTLAARIADLKAEMDKLDIDYAAHKADLTARWQALKDLRLLISKVQTDALDASGVLLPKL